jgi:hypothetical protein
MVDQAPATKADIERIESKLDHILRATCEVFEALKRLQRESDLRSRQRVRSTILATAAGFDFADVLQRPRTLTPKLFSWVLNFGSRPKAALWRFGRHVSSLGSSGIRASRLSRASLGLGRSRHSFAWGQLLPCRACAGQIF